MALRVINSTIAATTTAQQLITPVAGHKTPIQEITIDPTGLGGTNPLYIGNSSVSSTNYALKLPGSTAGTRITIGSGPAGFAIFNLEDLWVSGTQNDVVHALALTL